MNDGPTLETMYAWVSEYPDGSIGLVGGGFLGVGQQPLVTRSERIARTFYRPFAELHKQTSGQRVWLRKYTVFVDEADI